MDSKPPSPPSGFSPRYQVVLLGPERLDRRTALQATLQRRCAELGLIEGDLMVLTEETFDVLRDPGGPLAAVYLGPGETELGNQILGMLVQQGTPIFALVPTLEGYRRQVPPCLHGFEARVYDLDDPTEERTAAWIMEELGLLRKRRLAFISYRRVESKAVALQLYHALDDRSFQVFLDTHSIRDGALFEEAIGGSLSDAELVILLGTPKVFESAWVEKEFARASQMGLGVLYVRWPGHVSPDTAAFARMLDLLPDDFITGDVGADSHLSEQALARIIVAAEGHRARSFAARQTRIISAFCRRVNDRGCQALRMPERFIAVRHPAGTTLRAYPVVGHPDTRHMERIHKQCESDPKRACLLYDPDGIPAEVASHLGWLNGFAPIRAISLTEADEWIARP